MDLAAASLDPASDPAGSDRSDGQMKKKRKSGGGGALDAAAAAAECDTWRMRTTALAALRRLFTHDAGDFLDAGRFNQLHPLVTRQLTAAPPAGAWLPEAAQVGSTSHRASRVEQYVPGPGHLSHRNVSPRFFSQMASYEEASIIHLALRHPPHLVPSFFLFSGIM